jgi:hypothetical protein
MAKDVYLQQLFTIVTALAQSIDTAETLISAYFDRAYGASGANEITADDLAGYPGMTPAHITSAITLFQQLQNLRSGGAVYPSDYDATLNQLRQDL